ncbi:hypothetical protein G9C98_004528 [Cotesia typhae]|uniref:Uncharacterized protein n=1 Tax=Cotesia typhae TaxID=2053667 RepID=A0A8J5R2P8_9HYME|nr:hypothetical protein G9C98_004528 [Cotesia typhae]
MQFKTFGHLENEDINTIDYERSTSVVDFERSKTPRWHKQRYFPSIAEVKSKLRASSRAAVTRGGSGSDTSGSPCGECAGPSYRVPVKPCRDVFSRGVESSTESNNEGSPSLTRRPTRNRQQSIRSTRREFIRDIDSEFSSVEDMTLLPPIGFSDRRELSEAECDRDRDWHPSLSIATTRHGGSLARLPIEAVETMFARYQQRKEQEKQELTIHV